ncbi:MAG: HlyD family efflux transporter periplasmic adaptor subunit [Tatlockia sp.]|jgi:membrane fusion protein
MENNSSLFRNEVIANRLNRNLGSTRINVPLNFRVAIYFTLVILCGIFLLFYFAQLTEVHFIRGYLDSENGVISVESEFHGIVEKAFVEEGKSFKKGALLYRVLTQEKRMAQEQANNVKQRIRNLKQEYQLKEAQHQGLLTLFEKHYVSSTNVKNSESALLELENKIKGVEYELLKFKESCYQLIRAPVEGTVTNVFVHQAQSVHPSKTLVQLIPKDAHFVARLYVPSRHMGFLKPGQKINIKYDAYPSQRFGFYEAIIKEINQTILTDEKEDKPLKIGEPYYKIKAVIKKQSVTVYGKGLPLSHGMTLTAVVRGEKKKIWQWITDPIVSYFGENS